MNTFVLVSNWWLPLSRASQLCASHDYNSELASLSDLDFAIFTITMLTVGLNIQIAGLCFIEQLRKSDISTSRRDSLAFPSASFLT